jgi:hypothetical protein
MTPSLMIVPLVSPAESAYCPRTAMEATVERHMTFVFVKMVSLDIRRAGESRTAPFVGTPDWSLAVLTV